MGSDSQEGEGGGPSSSFPLSSPGFWEAAAKVASSAGAVIGEVPESKDPVDAEGLAGKRSRSLTPPTSPLAKVEDGKTAEGDILEPVAKRIRHTSPRATTLTYLPNRADPFSDMATSTHAYLAGAEYAPNAFGDIGDYMRKKEIKVQTQNRDIAMSDPAAANLPQIFVGQSFYINGNTHPPMEELRKMILQRGGEVRPVLRNKGMVKFIIAPMLTQMKFKQFQNYRVVREGWIIESCAQGKLLDWTRWKLTVQGGWEEEGRKGMEGFLKSTQAPQPPQPSSSGSTQGRQPVADVISHVPTAKAISSLTPPKETSPSPKLAHRMTADIVDDVGSLPPSVNTKELDVKSPRPPSLVEPRIAQVTVKPSISSAIPISPGQTASPGDDKVPPKVHRPEGAFEYYSTKESNDDAARMLQNQEWRLKNTAERGNEGGFIDGYYANSRLHHLSTWKAELRVLVAAAQRQSEENSLKAPSSTGISSLSFSNAALPRSAPALGTASVTGGTGEKVIFHVDFDCFFVSCGLATRPHLKGKPAVVCHSTGGRMEGSTSEIASASYEARAKGVRNGMSLGRARTLVGEGLQTIPYEFETYKKFSLSFYTVLMGYADELQAVSVDEALIDATSAVAARAAAPEEAGSADDLEVLAAEVPDAETSTDGPDEVAAPKRRDPAVEIAEKIRDEVRRDTGCEVSIGISHNILLAKLATRRAKPAGVYHLLPAEVPTFLAPLDVEDFPSVGGSIRSRIEEKFGTTIVGELSSYSRGNIRAVLGPKTGDMVWGYIRGADERRIEPHKERKSISAEMNYGIRFQNQDQAEICVKDLAIEVSKRMKNVSAKGRLMTLKLLKRHPDAPIEPPKFLGHGWCETFNRSSPIGTKGGGSTDDQNIMGAEAVRLLRMMKLDPVELRGIGIQITKLDAEKGEREAGQGVLSFQKRQGAADVKIDSDFEFDEKDRITEDEEGQDTSPPQSRQEPPTTAQDQIRSVPEITSLHGQVQSTKPTVQPFSTNAVAGPSRQLAPAASSDGIDPEFLAALPADLQAEVKQQHARTRAEKKRAADANSHSLPTVGNTRQSGPPTTSARPVTVPKTGLASTKHVAAHISKQLRPKIKTQLKAGQIADLALYSAWNKADSKKADAPTRGGRSVDYRSITPETPNERRLEVDLTASPETPKRGEKRRRSVSTEVDVVSIMSDGEEVEAVPMDGTDPAAGDAKIGLFFTRDLKMLGIDPTVFEALPADMQKEVVEEERRKARQRKLLHRPADTSRQRAREREVERKLGFSASAQDSNRKGSASRTVSLSPTRRGTRGRSGSANPDSTSVPRINVVRRNADRPSLLNATELKDVLVTIEKWIDSRGKNGPAERDSKKVEAYLMKLVEPRKHHKHTQALGGVEMAVECLKWMRLILKEKWGEEVGQAHPVGDVEQKAEAARRQWWATWNRFVSSIDDQVQTAIGAPLRL